MSILDKSVLNRLEREFTKVWTESSKDILSQIQVLAGSYFGESPSRDDLVLRSGDLLRDLQSNDNKTTTVSNTQVTSEKIMTSPYAFLLGSENKQVTPRQRNFLLMQYYLSMHEDPRALKVGGLFVPFMWKTIANRGYYEGRKFIFRAIGEVDLKKTIKRVFGETFKPKNITVVIGGK